tara:strand:- start:1442 stop:1852 length:411 start_codon:yes stop_codon:yes gene_type:complete
MKVSKKRLTQIVKEELRSASSHNPPDPSNSVVFSYNVPEDKSDPDWEEFLVSGVRWDLHQKIERLNKELGGTEPKTVSKGYNSRQTKSRQPIPLTTQVYFKTRQQAQQFKKQLEQIVNQSSIAKLISLGFLGQNHQ